MNMKDYYEILDVSREATTTEIKRAFRELARRLHPDMAGDDPTADEKFRKVRRAYEVLVDPGRRARYDSLAGIQRGHVAFESWFQRSDIRGRRGPVEAPSHRGNGLGLDDIFQDLGGFCKHWNESPARQGRKGGQVGPGDPPSSSGEFVHGRSMDSRSDESRSGKGTGIPDGSVDNPITIEVSVAEALLGASFEIATFQSPVLLSLPPCTSGGTVLRVKNKGPVGPGGVGRDLYVQVRIRLPASLNQESQELIKKFARLNPQKPRT